MFYDIFSACETCLLFVAFNGMRRQGRIKVRGGPRLDTVMGPYPFSSFIKLSTTHTEFLGISPLESFKLQMPVGELSIRALLPNYTSNL